MVFGLYLGRRNWFNAYSVRRK
uniref:Uncharacterized protein n=1 Tax=Arundo donax TaxID=35708 RepID=A0A0A8ZGZ6_ARUDO